MLKCICTTYSYLQHSITYDLKNTADFISDISTKCNRKYL